MKATDAKYMLPTLEHVLLHLSWMKLVGQSEGGDAMLETERYNVSSYGVHNRWIHGLTDRMNFCDWHPNPFDWYGVALAGCTLVCCYVQNVDDRLPPPRHGQFPIPSIHQRIRSAYNPPDMMLRHSLHRDYFVDKRSVPDLVPAFGMTPVRRKHTWMPKKIRKRRKTTSCESDQLK